MNKVSSENCDIRKSFYCPRINCENKKIREIYLTQVPCVLHWMYINQFALGVMCESDFRHVNTAVAIYCSTGAEPLS